MREIGVRPHPKKKTNIFKIFFLTFILAIFTLAIFRLLNIEKLVLKGPKTVVQLITNTGLNSYKGRTNLLVLGTSGSGHDGPDLSDTMILASIDKNDQDVLLISIPRDLWAPDIGAKINTAYAFGQAKGQGLKLAKDTLSRLLGIPIHYAIRVDFGGFVQAVDLVGGLDIDVENSFVDSHYPIEGKEDDLCGLTLETEEKDGARQQVVKDATGSAMPLDKITPDNDPFTCRYETLSFQKGQAHMDGTTALKFVRSRYGTNNEGSDFARSARQHKVILAFRQKVLSSQTLTSPKTIIDLAKTFGQSIDTDITDEEIPLFVKLGTKIEPQNIRRVVLDATRQESVLEVGNLQDYAGQYVLVPKGGSWTDLGEFIQSEIFKLEQK